MGYLNAIQGSKRQPRTVAGAPTAGTDEIQTLTFGGTPTGGTFELSFKGQRTGAITWSSTNATLVSRIDAALEALNTVGTGNVTTAEGTMTNGIGTITVTFVSALGKLAVPLLTVDGSLLEGTAPTLAVEETTPGVTATARGSPTGTEIIRTSNGVKYVNTGTATAPTWTQQTVPSAEMAALEAAIPGAAIVSLTDNSGGATGNDTLVAGAGRFTLAIPVLLSNIADGDLMTDYTPGFAGKILKLDYVADVVASTGGKASTIHAEIGATPTTGGALALTTSSAGTKGAVTAGSAITADNAFSATDTISLVAASTTTFTQGAGYFLLELQNTTAVDNLADLAAKINTILARLRTLGLVTP